MLSTRVVSRALSRTWRRLAVSVTTSSCPPLLKMVTCGANRRARKVPVALCETERPSQGVCTGVQQLTASSRLQRGVATSACSGGGSPDVHRSAQGKVAQELLQPPTGIKSKRRSAWQDQGLVHPAGQRGGGRARSNSSGSGGQGVGEGEPEPGTVLTQADPGHSAPGDSHGGSSVASLATHSSSQQLDSALHPHARMLVLDAMALLYRAHHASFGPSGRLSNSHGEDTSVLFRFFKSLFGILEAPAPPSHLVVVLDSGGPTFRHEISSGYKGQREACPPQVSAAANRLLVLLPLLGIPVVREAGWEADDVIGTLALRAVEAGLHVGIVSPDKDFLQLLRPGLELLRIPTKTTGKAKYLLPPYTHQDFARDYGGLAPAQYAEVLALAGDSADSIPGLPNIGEKTAMALLQQFGSMQGLLESAEQVKRKPAREALTAPGAAQQAQDCLAMATIRTNLDDLPLAGLPPEHWRLRGVGEEDRAAAVREFEWLEFKSLLQPLQRHLDRLAALP